MAAKNSSCVILVPAYCPVSPKCEEGLRELESRGYPIRRVRGFSAIDQGRNQMASAALLDGFEETMWIDPDIGFPVDAVEKLRSHHLPICCGVYPQPPGRSLACHVLPGTEKLAFGEKGGLVEIKYAAAGFLHVRREAYETIRDRLRLPLCNTRFGRGNWPFFQPLAVEEGSGFGVQGSAGRGRESGRGGEGENSEIRGQEVTHRYLTEDYAFSYRVRLAGLKVMADTSIRLWRMASYSYGWEDAGGAAERFETYHYHVE